MPSACAAARVTPMRHSSTVIRNSVAARFIARSSEDSGEVPGIAVSRQAPSGCHAARSAVERRQLASRAGNRTRPATAPRPCRLAPWRDDACFIDVFQVIGRQRVKFGGERRAVHVGELFGVQLHSQPRRVARRLEHPPGLLAREADLSQNASTASIEAFAHQRRQHDRADLVDVVIRAAGEFRRQGVRAQKGGAHGDGAFACRARARRAVVCARARAPVRSRT